LAELFLLKIEKYFRFRQRTLQLTTDNSHLLAPNRVRFKYLFLICALHLLLGAFFLGTVPRIYLDETWDASLAHELCDTGVLRHPFIQNFGGMEIYFVQPRIILPIICAGVFKIFGYSIAISRMPSLLMGILAAISLYHIAEYFFGSKQGFFAGLLTIIYPWFWNDCRHCRPEIYYTAFGLLFLWLVISYFQRSRALMAIIAGLTAALASLSHPNGLIFIIAISICWIIWKEIPHFIKFAVWASAGFVLTILPYVFYVFWAVRHPGVSLLEQLQTDSLGGSLVHKEIVRWSSFFQLPFGIPIAFIMFTAWLMAWWKSAIEDKFIAAVPAIYVLSLPLLSVNCIPEYLVVVIPFLSMLIVRLMYRLREFTYLANSRRMYYIAKYAIILIYVSTSLTPIMILLYMQRKADFNIVVNKVAKVIGPDARLYADPIFWVGHDRYIYGPYLSSVDIMTSKKDLLEWAYSESIGYVARTAWGITPPRGFQKPSDKMPKFRPRWIADVLCEAVGVKVYEFYDEYYGPVEIYKLDWSKAWKLRLKKQ
jgi:4-amino-4-deoxy-L-arabinose transferase-like glycosyltransferase